MSGNIFEPRALDELYPDWRDDESCPIKTKVTEDSFMWLPNGKKKVTLPNMLLPKEQHNEG